MMKNIWKKLPNELRYTNKNWEIVEELEDTRDNLRLCIVVSLCIIITQIINCYF